MVVVIIILYKIVKVILRSVYNVILALILTIEAFNILIVVCICQITANKFIIYAINVINAMQIIILERHINVAMIFNIVHIINRRVLNVALANSISCYKVQYNAVTTN